MTEQQQSLDAIHDIKKMMERSSRFISLSGLSGVSAGVCALIGAWLAHPYVYGYKNLFIDINQPYTYDATVYLNTWLFWIAMGTFVAALLSAFVFTYIKSKKDGTPIWGKTARRLMINVLIPVAVGGIFLLSMMQYGTFGLVAPGCLLFYGLALINASKYSLNELRYLGYCEIILGIINLNFVGYGLYFWAAGFGILHIAYGVYMWYNYEREN
ncbi:MAG TPA: hypothetical protein PK504_00650 [Ferruginibacter sp.]|nr:hypothetical protein [Ferruginibacter sp.]HRE62375.1 hypothetical protein [Ferruginibacter sp.]